MKTGRRATTQLTIDGRTRFLVDLAMEYEIDPKIVRARIAEGWSAERAVSTPQTYFPQRERRGGFYKKRKRIESLPAPVPVAPQSASFRPRLGSFKSYPIEALDTLRRLA